ncbi:hypothetical protein [Microbacterium gilvum]|uniref:Asp23/Gls24 family envelope stress response protein n=1 Tax=Microbacterium gilvum TaxID=1336204 RepID=A0ABP9A5E3_9MICO
MSVPEGALRAAAVRGVAGVVDVYAAEGALIASVAALLGHESSDDPVVDRDDRVSARIGTAMSASTPDVARRVADVLRDGAPPQARIAVRIARVS